jgi:hypothetical protein
VLCTPASPMVIFVVVLAFSSLMSCATSRTICSEILIAIKPEAIPLLNNPEEPDPFHTGIPSLDSLNRKWDVYQMIRVFPDVSPDDETAARYGLAGIFKLVVPKNTDLTAMIQDYQTDQHVDYAEMNQPYEIK